MRMKKDLQRWRVYDAEVAAEKRFTRPLEDEDAFVEFINETALIPQIKKRYGKQIFKRLIECRVSLRAKSSSAYDNEIVMAPNHLHTMGVLHEFAHVIQLRTHDRNSTDFAFHDRSFTSVYLFLVRHAMGKAAYRCLKEQFDLYEVDYVDI